MPTRARRARRLAAVITVLVVYVGLIFALAWRYAALPDAAAQARCEVRGDWFYRGGDKYLVKGVGYDPARPGELPWARDRSLAFLDDDFARIRAAGFNTVRTWEPLDTAGLDAAQRHGLAVIQGLWIDPAGAFADPAFRSAAVARAAEQAKAVRGHPAVMAWLVMNEPRPEQVLSQGLTPSRTLLRELAETVREHDPGVPVGFASWPGLEFLDEPSLDFVAANLYPFRPGALVRSVGYAGLVQLWKQDVARDRPLLVSEFGLSVAPGTIAPDAPGGVTEAEQERALPLLAEDVARAGAAGGAVFMWIDGWWKNGERPDDAQTHDPDDGEEWFGLHAMDTLTDDVGRPRPALAAMRAYNRAVLTLPADGPVPGREVELEVHTEEAGPLRLEVALAGGPAVVVPTVREGAWLRGRMGLLASAPGPQRLDVVVYADAGPVARFTRTVVPPGQAPTLTLTEETDGGRALVATVLQADGAPAEGRAVSFALAEPSRHFDREVTLPTDAAGLARLPLDLPAGAVVLASAALRDGDAPPLRQQSLVLGLEGR